MINYLIMGERVNIEFDALCYSVKGIFDASESSFDIKNIVIVLKLLKNNDQRF